MKNNPFTELQSELIELGTSDPEACPYLADRRASLAYSIPFISNPGLFDRLLEFGYRRNGPLFYRPDCPGGCRRCVPIRIPVQSFALSKSQRRLLNKVQPQFTVKVKPPEFHPEHLRLFNRHAKFVSEEATSISQQEYLEFLFQSQVETHQFNYFIEDELVGVGFLDTGEKSASSIYFYWDPDFKEYSPGTFSALYEIDWCRNHGFEHYYLGYWIKDCPSMAYKERFRPHELMHWEGDDWHDGIWK